MREGMFDRTPLSGLAAGVPVLDFRKAPGSRGGKAGEAARFMAALRTMAMQQDRDTFSVAELQVMGDSPATHQHALRLQVCTHRAVGGACAHRFNAWLPVIMCPVPSPLS